jgi:hypothetical protein
MKTISIIILLFLISIGCSQNKIDGKFNSEDQLFESKDSTIWTGWYKNGLATFSKNGYLGLIDEAGKIVCHPKYDKIYDFEGEIAKVVLNSCFGLINNKGKELLPPKLNAILDFQNKVAIYQYGRRYGIIKENGKLLTKPIFSGLYPFQYEGLIYYEDSIIGVINPKAKKTALFNLNQDKIIGLSYSGYPILAYNKYESPLLDFHEELTPNFKKIEDYYKFGFMDKNFEVVIKPSYEWVKPFNKGYALVMDKGKWGMIDKRGNLIIPPIYHTIRYGEKDKFIVSLDGELFGVIDINNNNILDYKYSSLHYLFQDLYATIGEPLDSIYLANSYSSKIVNSWGVIKENGEQILPFIYQGVGMINDTIGIVSKHVSSFSYNTGNPTYEFFGTYSSFDRDGINRNQNRNFSKFIKGGFDSFSGYVIPDHLDFFLPLVHQILDPVDSLSLTSNYRKSETLQNGFSIISTKELFMFSDFGGHVSNIQYGIMDDKENIVVPVIYEELDNVGLNIFRVKIGDRYGVIDLKNKTIVPIIYDLIEISESVMMIQKKIAEYDYEFSIFDFAGQMLIPFTKYRFSLNNDGSILYKKAYGNYSAYSINKNGDKIEYPFTSKAK